MNSGRSRQLVTSPPQPYRSPPDGPSRAPGEDASTAGRHARLPLAIAMAGLVLLWLVWYPPAISIMDESAYLTQARLFAAGKVTGDASARTVMMLETPRGWVSKYPPAQSLILAPAQWLHWRAAFLSPLACVLVAALFCAATLERNGIPGGWALLLPLHPAVVLYSRTMMSEALALLVVAVALWASDPDRPRSLGAGLAIGVMPAVRTALLPIALVLGVLTALRLRRTAGVAAVGPLALGAAVPLVALAAYNQAVFGDPFSLRVAWPAAMDWSTAHERGLFYVLALNVLWPGMLVGICAAQLRRRLDVLLLAATAFAVYSGYWFVDRRYGMPADLVVGFRFFVPLLPALVLGYAALLHRSCGRWIRSVRVPAAAAVLLVAANAVVVAAHQEFLAATAERRKAAVAAARAGGAVAAHWSAAELFNPAWGGPPVVLHGSVRSLRRAVAASACEPAGAVGFAQGAAAAALAAAAGAVTPAEGLTLIRSDPSACPDARDAGALPRQPAEPTASPRPWYRSQAGW